jgi:hypothetical protein
MRNRSLLLSLPSNERTTKKNIIGRKRATTGRVASPSNIRVGLEMKRARAWKEQMTSNGPMQVTQDTKKMTIVELTRSKNKLRMCAGQVMKHPHIVRFKFVWPPQSCIHHRTIITFVSRIFNISLRLRSSKSQDVFHQLS